MFLSPIFAQTLASVSDVTIELYNTDGAAGAAKGAGIGIGLYSTPQEAFASLEKLGVIEPEADKKSQYREAYTKWRQLIK